MPLTITLLWVMVGILAVMGGYLTIMNYLCLAAAVFHHKHSSMIPLLGGLFLAIALLACPLHSVQAYVWVPFVIDLGCLALLIDCFRFFIIQKGHKR